MHCACHPRNVPATVLQLTRRRLAAAPLAWLATAAAGAGAQGPAVSTSASFILYTFGDSILDCGRYNDHGVHPGGLLVRNHDGLFPEFRGRDMSVRLKAQLEQRAVDGSTVAHLASQAAGIRRTGNCAALLTIGGNDLLQGLAADTGPGVKRFAQRLEQFLAGLPIHPVLIGNVYDPTFGDDARNFLGVDPARARANHARVNDVLATLARRHGQLVDLHAHFLHGQPSWFTRTIEPSLIGASEIRRAFMPALGLA
jgi:acyl-CoA thioesterase I